jgi:hypothetical protein
MSTPLAIEEASVSTAAGATWDPRRSATNVIGVTEGVCAA